MYFTYNPETTKILGTPELQAMREQLNKFKIQEKIACVQFIGLMFYDIARKLPEGASITIEVETNSEYDDMGGYYPCRSLSFYGNQINSDSEEDLDSIVQELSDDLEYSEFAGDLAEALDLDDFEFTLHQSIVKQFDAANLDGLDVFAAVLSQQFPRAVGDTMKAAGRQAAVEAQAA